MDAAAPLCADGRYAPLRAHGVRDVSHFAHRTRLVFNVAFGPSSDEAEWLADESGAELVDPFACFQGEALPEGSHFGYATGNWGGARGTGDAEVIEAGRRALLHDVEAVSRFTGTDLERRVLAAHPPSANTDKEIAKHPLAVAALLSLYTDVCMRHPLFAPLVLGRDASTPEGVLALLSDVRAVVEDVEKCGGLWAHSVFRGFIKMSALDEGLAVPRAHSFMLESITWGCARAAVQRVVEVNEAVSELTFRARCLLGGHTTLAAAAAATGAPVRLADVEDFATALAVALPGADDYAELAALRAAVDELAAAQPGKALCAEAFAASRGAALLALAPAPSTVDLLQTKTALMAVVIALINQGNLSYRVGRLGALLHHRLTPPRALALAYGPLRGNVSISFDALVESAYAEAAERDGAAGVMAALQQAPPRGMPAVPPRNLRALLFALEHKLKLRLCRGVPEPDTWRDLRWFSLSKAAVEMAILKTGVHRVPEELAVAVGELPRSDEGKLAAIEACFTVLADHWWVMEGASNPRHPFVCARELVMEILVVGARLSGSPARFGALWDTILNFPEGPPTLCDGGYGSLNGTDECVKCGMPSKWCPSLHHLRAELTAKLAEKGVSEEDARVLVSASTAKAAAGFLCGRKLENMFSSGREPISEQLEDVVRELVDEGVLQVDGYGVLAAWRFSGAPRPTRLVDSKGSGVEVVFVDAGGGGGGP